MTASLTGAQVREACELLGWTRYDLQRATALPFYVVDRILAADNEIETTLAREIVVRDALQRAGVDAMPENPRVLRVKPRNGKP